MAGGPLWTDEEINIALIYDKYDEYVVASTDRGFAPRPQGSWRSKRSQYLSQEAAMVRVPEHVPEHVSWREVNRHLRGIQTIRKRASPSNSQATFRFETDEPICIIALADTHIGSIATDHDALERLTDDILSIPNLYVGLLGDVLDFAVKLRGVAEVQGNILNSEMQYAYLLSWLDELADRICFASWGNHDVEREEQLVGTSRLGRIMADRGIVYYGGIGHCEMVVGSQTYRMAVSHHFQGRSMYNPVHGAQRYATMTDGDVDIVMAGDSHVPGILQWTHGKHHKIALNTGSIQTHSSYAKRYFSLTTHPVFPCLVLHPDQYLAVPYWSIGAWQASVHRKEST